MLETANSWVLPETSIFRREPARPLHRRQANFDLEFDALTVFYDCFRVGGTKVMLLGPPLHRFDGVLDSLRIKSLPSGSQCRYEAAHMYTTGFAGRQTHNLCRLTVNVPEGDRTLDLQCAAGHTALEIRPNGCEVFRGLRVLFTLSKNNHPAWVCDWMRFHRDLQGANAVLLYDNGSTAYSAPSLLEAMQQVSGFQVVCVVSWPYKYGPQGVGRGTWDSAFSQDGAMEDARWRFLARSSAVLNCDIDELVLSSAGSVFDKAAASPSGYINFAGRWVNTNGAPVSPTPLHRESAYELRPHWRWTGLRPKDVHLCPKKWVVAPERCPIDAHWSVHEIVGMPASKLKPAETCYRHFRQITTNWKNRRTEIEVPARRQRKDSALLAAFAQVKWDI